MDFKHILTSVQKETHGAVENAEPLGDPPGHAQLTLDKGAAVI